jgi:ABC-type nickel/cobalt efflux system permease component RcnA
MRRSLAVAGLVAVAFLLIPSAPASAHPLGNFTVNLYSGLVVEPGRLTVDYVLDMAEIPTFQELPSIDSNGDGAVSAGERAAYASRKAGLLVGGLRAMAGGERVALRVVSASMRFRPGQAGLRILRLQAVFTGRVRSTGALTYHDGNYGDRLGWREITAVGASGEAVRGASVPARSVSDTLLRYPTALLSSPLRVTDARLRFAPGVTGAAPGFPRAGAEGARPLVTGGAFAKLATWSGVTVWVFLLAILLAMGFGAIHALLPGHGKTIMAAYLVGAGGRIRQAAQVGVAVALMHTASVLALGIAVFLLAGFAPERAYPWITLASGVVVIGLGIGLFVARLRRRGAAHVHGVHEHHHQELAVRERELVAVGGGTGAVTIAPVVPIRPEIAHGNGHSHPVVDRPLSRRRLAGLAAAGGILPSPTAIVVLVSTFTAHRVAFGLSLIVAFSVGLAGALVAVGIVALRARTFVSTLLQGSAIRLLPLASAAVITGFGVYFVARGAAGI